MACAGGCSDAGSGRKHGGGGARLGRSTVAGAGAAVARGTGMHGCWGQLQRLREAQGSAGGEE